jgi:hypothetical protein
MVYHKAVNNRSLSLSYTPPTATQLPCGRVGRDYFGGSHSNGGLHAQASKSSGQGSTDDLLNNKKYIVS